MLDHDVLALTQSLIRCPTANPPGHEETLAKSLASLLENHGFDTHLQSFGKGRTNLVASIGGTGDRKPICFSGHLDTVPIGTQSWAVDPYGGETSGDRIYGRGACDMKGGIAAFLSACIDLCAALQHGPGVRLVLTGGEETGCEGARHLADSPHILGDVGALIIAEPTGLTPFVGHKGALWLKGHCNGVSAHGSVPHLGNNAIYKIARKTALLEQFSFQVAADEFLGAPTLNVGTIAGGVNVNSVPDRAQIEIDIRSIPTQSHNSICSDLKHALGDDVELTRFVDLPGVWTDPDTAWVMRTSEIVSDTTGLESDTIVAPYFTDASVLKPAFNDVQTMILGPGEISVAHTVNEYCTISQLLQAKEIYSKIIVEWCGV